MKVEMTMKYQFAPIVCLKTTARHHCSQGCSYKKGAHFCSWIYVIKVQCLEKIWKCFFKIKIKTSTWFKNFPFLISTPRGLLPSTYHLFWELSIISPYFCWSFCYFAVEVCIYISWTLAPLFFYVLNANIFSHSIGNFLLTEFLLL